MTMKKDKTIIIAEIGVNHNGKLKLAKKLIEIAAKAKVDYVKFQTSIPSLHISENAKQAIYQKNNFPIKNNSQLAMAKKLAFDFKIFPTLKKFCRKKNVKFLSSAFDIESVKFLHKLKQDYFKIPSSEITNYPYLKELGKLSKKIILSTGMSNLKMVEDAIKVLQKYGTKKKDIILLHCNTAYPTPIKDVNLNAMLSLKKKFKCEVGYSDHTEGNIVSLAAVSLGAKIIERHITISKKMKGPDHKSSLEPKELIKLVKNIRDLQTALGNKNKNITNSEKKNVIAARKSLVAAKKIIRGEKFTPKNITSKRPGSGLSPMLYPTIIGKKSKKNYNKDELIKQ
jgi:N,N'-diacetyllegionaminate synthase